MPSWVQASVATPLTEAPVGILLSMYLKSGIAFADSIFVRFLTEPASTSSSMLRPESGLG